MRYQYTSKGYLNSLKNNNTLSGVQQLLIINIAIFIVMLLSNSFDTWTRTYFALNPKDVCKNWEIWQCVTYLFLHSTHYIWHILGNMIGLWFLGSALESIWGKRKFLKYYFVVGVGSGFITAIYMINFYPNVSTIGASGSIYGLLVAYAILFPDRILYIYGLIPVKAKTIAIILGGIALFYSINSNQSSINSNQSSANIGHITHLAGIAMASLYLIYWTKKKQSMKIIKLHKHKKNNSTKIREKNVNEILDKINDVGWDSLTDEDKEYLNKESKNNHFDEPPN